MSVSNGYTIPILTPTAWQNANTGYEFLYWTGSDGKQYSVGGAITISQDTTLTAYWYIPPIDIGLEIQNNTGDTVLVVFKYKDSIATFRVVGDKSATSGVTKNYSFKI